MQITKEYQWIAASLIIFLIIFPHVSAANIPSSHSNFEIWNGQLSDNIYDIAISDNGQYIVAGSTDGTVSLIDRSGKLLWAYNNQKANGLLANPEFNGDKWTSVAISSDGEYIAAGIWDNSEEWTRSPKILFFDRSGTLIWTDPAENVADIAITPNGNNIAVIADSSALFFNKDGKVVWEYDGLDSRGSISVSDDGSFVGWTGDYNSASMFDASGSLMWENQTARRWVAE
jgi:WD40 repeat protein